MAKLPKYATDITTFNTTWKRLVALRDETKKRLEEVESLIKTLNASSNLPDEVKENINELKSEANQLRALLATTQTYATSIENYYKSWGETKQKIDDEYNEAQQHNQTLEGYETKVQELSTNLTDEIERSSSLLDDAKDTLDLVTNGALSTVFSRRSKDRKNARHWWGAFVVIATLLFVAAVLFAVYEIAEDIKAGNQLSVWILKIALVSPFVYILYFVTRQYSHERDLEEKYAFKSLISQTIQNNTKLLKDQFLEREEVDKDIELKIVDFTVKSLEAVYKEPFNSSSLESKVKFSLRKPEAEAEVSQKGEA